MHLFFPNDTRKGKGFLQILTLDVFPTILLKNVIRKILFLVDLPQMDRNESLRIAVAFNHKILQDWWMGGAILLPWVGFCVLMLGGGICLFLNKQLGR